MNRKGDFSAISELLFGISCDSALGLALRAALSCQLSRCESLRRIKNIASAQSLERLDLAQNSPFLYLITSCSQTGEVTG